jgi:tetratricopeptide (TPR) repeat protein
MLLLTVIAFVLMAQMPPHQDLLKRTLARRDYTGATAHFRSAVSANPTNTRDMRNLARVYDHMHEYDSAVAWWSQALYPEPESDSSIVGRWNALFHRDENDSVELPVTKASIAADAAVFAKGSSVRDLTLASDGFSLADSAKAVAVALKLTRLYPDSPRGYEIIGAMFYDSLYPVWNNDTAKVPIIRRFLKRFPRTEWRQTFYMFLISSLFGLRDTAQLRSAAAEMVRDDTLDPFRPRYAAAIFNRLKLDPARAESFARRAIALEPIATKPANKPQEQWDLDYPPLYGLARLALAEALKLQGRFDEAKIPLDEAINRFRWDPQQEATPGPFCCLVGEIAEAQGDTAAALASYARALEAGDSRSTWTFRADSGFKRLHPGTDREVTTRGRKLLDFAGPCFTDVTDSFGLGDRRESRVAWGDYNNDGFEDLLLSGSVLFRNDSGRRFTNVTDAKGMTESPGDSDRVPSAFPSTKGRGGLFADLNNDGWLDLYVAASAGGARFLRNDSGRFVDISDRAGGPDNDFPTEGAGWADFDADGWVDLYCANYENWEKHTYYPDALYQNRRGYLADVTKRAGIIPPYAKDLAGRGVNWADFDDDGDQDCFVSNYRLCENFLWVNNGDSTFANRAGELGVSGDEVNGWYGHTIGSTWGDFDNDGDLDLFTADLAHPRYIEFSNRSRLYENQGPTAYPRFRDRRAELGIRYEETHSDPAWADVDNDGDQDLYITSIYEGRRSFLYENRGPDRESPSATRDAPFAEVTWLSGTRVYNGWGCAFADFDNDGDQDLVVGSGSGVKLFRNDTKNGNHWLRVRVIGAKANRVGIGCRVTITEKNGRRQVREVEGGKGTMSQNSLIQHFGLGRFLEPVTVEVRFGPGRTRVLKNVRPDRLLVVKE